MDYLVCINTNSFPAQDIMQANILFIDAIQGVLQLTQDSNDRVIFYLDSVNNECLQSLELAPEYNYSDFLLSLEENNEIDLLTTLFEIEDKSPALDYFDDDTLENITEYQYYLKDSPLSNNPTVFSIAWNLNATLLSLNTSNEWSNNRIEISRTLDGQYIENIYWIDNISTNEHGKSLYDAIHSIDITQKCAHHYISEELLDWYEAQSNENKIIISKKIELSVYRNFQGGKPLFDTLINAHGIREIRFDAHNGGAIRILFKELAELKQALLIGFIKKANNSGYATNIERAYNLYCKL